MIHTQLHLAAQKIYTINTDSRWTLKICITNSVWDQIKSQSLVMFINKGQKKCFCRCYSWPLTFWTCHDFITLFYYILCEILSWLLYELLSYGQKCVSKRMLVPNLKKFPQGIPVISHLQQWDGWKDPKTQCFWPPLLPAWEHNKRLEQTDVQTVKE